MMRSIVFLALFALASATVSYQGYEVWRLEATREQHADVRQVVEEHHLDVWAGGRDWVHVLVSPEQKTVITEKLAQLSVHSTVYIDNVQALVDRSDEEQKNNRAGFDFEQYNSWEDIEAYLTGLPEVDSRTSIVSLGKTVEGRDLWQLRISVAEGKQPVWIDCGIHAREWISPATCLWGINYLLNGYGSDQAATDLLDANDIYMLVVNNPDGYAFSHTEQRFWRKNRMLYDGNQCTGIDLNRNFDEHFGGTGSSSNSCDETYKGPSAASELETQAVQAGIRDIADRANSLYSIHSYSQLWMYPYGWTCSLPPNYDQLDAISKTGVEALTSVHGTDYEYGTICSTIYPAASTTIDYSYTVGIVNSFTIELRDTGAYGFLLPADQIKPSGEETWAGMIAAILATPST